MNRLDQIVGPAGESGDNVVVLPGDLTPSVGNAIGGFAE
jgi:hypothetical protein